MTLVEGQIFTCFPLPWLESEGSSEHSHIFDTGDLFSNCGDRGEGNRPKKQKTKKKNMTWQVKVSLGRNEPEIIRNWAAARASILRPQIGWGKIFFQHVYWKRFQKLHSRMSSLNLFAFSSQSLLKTALASPIRTRYVWVDPERNLIKNYPYFITSSYLKAHDSCSKQDFRDVFGYRAGNPHCWAFGYGWGRHRHCVPMPRMKLNPQLWVLSTPTMIRRI